MLIMSACLIGYQMPVCGGAASIGCKRMFQAFAHSGLGGVGVVGCHMEASEEHFET